MLNIDRCLLLDGGMGTMLQRAGLEAGQAPERLNLTNPAAVEAVHAAYAAAGADIITANTFGASRRKLGEDPAPYIAAGIALARRGSGGNRLVALDVGPLGTLLEPFGELTFQEAYDLFAEVVRAGAAAGADLVLIETMSDLLEAKAALLAAKERTELPVLVTMTFGADGRTFLGVDPAAAAVTLTALGADGVGLNCSMGPRELRPVLREMLGATHLPVVIQPNAGLPRLVDGETVFDVGPEEFARWGGKFLEDGAAILGGCCGTTPEHIRALRGLLEGRRPALRRPDGLCRLCSWQGVRTLTDTAIAAVGERINPTGRPNMREALYTKNWDYAGEAAIAQQEEGADFLVVNAGLPDIDEGEALPQLVLAIQRASPLPLVIDCSRPAALERALRVCRGRPILNSVNGSPESLKDMLPLAVKYGTGLIVLALDETGISADPAVRANTALRVARTAEEAGVRREDIFIDCLAMAASVSGGGVLAAVEAIRLVRRAGYKTVLGVSNVSHGLPGRDELNCAFLAACLAAGLNVPIVNTGSPRVRDTLAAARVLTGEDPGCADFIASRRPGAADMPAVSETEEPGRLLQRLILSGRRADIPAVTGALLEKLTPLEVVGDLIMPALDLVGERYERGSLFLPQLMASAEAVKAACAAVRARMPQGAGDRGTILLATVKGDVHDIGKNIVKMLLENYGYRVVDLGRDVAPETLVKAALETRAPLVGLSALMTTTARNMAAAVRALRDARAPCKVMVGGAVVTEAFARQIGADFYARDAAQSARVAAQVFGDISSGAR